MDAVWLDPNDADHRTPRAIGSMDELADEAAD